MTQDLDVHKNPHNLSYKIPGLLSWLFICFGIAGLWAFPRVVLVGARIFAFYMLARFVLIMVFYFVGLARVRAAASRDRARPPFADDRPVYHVVLIPTHNEPREILARTLEALAGQQDARRRLIPVLAMEDAAGDGPARAGDLRAQFEDRFARFLITVHPANLPGDVPGKGANQAWAAREARRELVDQLHLPIERMTLTSCDADSIFHPRYFAELTRRFAEDPNRHLRFWQAPLLLDNNVWSIPAPIRLLTFFTNAVQLSELANPLMPAMPLSTYSLSFTLADRVGYWDRAVIAEDWHMFLRCFFATRGQVRLVPIFMPTSGDAVIGDTAWQAMRNFYLQQVRHSWGCQDISYILQQWSRQPGTPFVRKLIYLAKVGHDHLIFSVGGIGLVLGTLLSLTLEGTPVITLPPNFPYPVLLQAVNALGAIGTGGIWLSERVRLSSGRRSWRPFTMIQEVAAWTLFPAMTVFVTTVPVIQAQTIMLFGLSLAYFRTPKRVEVAGGPPRAEAKSIKSA